MNYEKCRAEDRAREAIREGNMIRKKRIVNNNDITINTSTTTTNTTSNSSTRNNAPVKSILKFSTKNTNNTSGTGTGAVAKSTRYLSQDDIKTKKWLLININKIIDNENNITLYNKLNIQLTTLIQQKDDLDTNKKRLIDVPESLSEIDEINDKLNIIEQQIKLKTIHINKIKSQIDNNDDTEDIYEKTIDNMKRNISLNFLRLLFEMVVKGKRV